MLYFRSAATEEGHFNAGHGNFENMKRRAGMSSSWTALKHRKAMEQQDTSDGDRLSAQLSSANRERGAELR